jgi:hypothetical protein
MAWDSVPSTIGERETSLLHGRIFLTNSLLTADYDPIPLQPYDYSQPQFTHVPYLSSLYLSSILSLLSCLSSICSWLPYWTFEIVRTPCQHSEPMPRSMDSGSFSALAHILQRCCGPILPPFWISWAMA